MAKKKKEEPKTIEITSASIKDDFCHYSFEITDGVGAGDTHSVKGSGIVKEDMHNAFAKLRVHLAILDSIFYHSKTDVVDIDSMHGHELTILYTVTGFQIKGSRENEGIILIGTKYSDVAVGRMPIQTPKIMIDDSSSYKWHNELKAAADACREEVELYKNGKYTAVEPEKETSADQGKLTFISGEDNSTGGDDNLSDFEKARK